MKPKSVRAVVLEQALSATVKSRNESYGDPFPNLCIAAELKAVYHKAAGNKYHPAHDEAIDMVLSKLARIACGATGHTDNYVDAAAYMAIAAECQEVHDKELRDAPTVSFQEACKAYRDCAHSPVVEDRMVPRYKAVEVPPTYSNYRKLDVPLFQTHDETKD
jgi:hypothetical protein